jgi:hypothetical protein
MIVALLSVEVLGKQKPWDVILKDYREEGSREFCSTRANWGEWALGQECRKLQDWFGSSLEPTAFPKLKDEKT